MRFTVLFSLNGKGTFFGVIYHPLSFEELSLEHTELEVMTDDDGNETVLLPSISAHISTLV